MPLTADLLSRLKPALADRYAVERELGAGGMARVFRAEEQHPRRHVAIKVLDPGIAKQQSDAFHPSELPRLAAQLVVRYM